MMDRDRNRIVTPTSDPDRWHEPEVALFDAGRCSWQIEYGNWGPSKYCGQPSNPGATFGYCAEHEAEHLESHWPDGSPRE
ncbi:hypothetical protein GCM10027589_22230 [Actinocorallia lasiicapitis]